MEHRCAIPAVSVPARPGNATRAEAEASIREYIEIFYNRQRRHSRLGYLAPAVFAQNYSLLQAAA